MKRALIDRAAALPCLTPTKPGNRIVGRVAGLGLSDEVNDRHYIVIDGIDGKVHYADVGHLRPELVPDKGMIVAVEAQQGSTENQMRTRLRILSFINLEKLAEAEGATWLDKELLTKTPEQLASAGFGGQTETALRRRQQWLVQQGLAEIVDQKTFRPMPRILDKLRQKDMQAAVKSLSAELGVPQAIDTQERISGNFTRTIDRPSGRFAVIQKSHEFTLVPWRPEMEQFRGRNVSGTRTSAGISWNEDARARSLGL